VIVDLKTLTFRFILIIADFQEKSIVWNSSVIHVIGIGHTSFIGKKVHTALCTCCINYNFCIKFVYKSKIFNKIANVENDKL
jgi:hypothetical protein